MVSDSFYDPSRGDFADGMSPDPRTQHAKRTALTTTAPGVHDPFLHKLPSISVAIRLGLNYFFCIQCGHSVIVLFPLRVFGSHTATRPEIDVFELVRLTRRRRETNVLGACIWTFATGHVNGSTLDYSF